TDDDSVGRAEALSAGGSRPAPQLVDALAFQRPGPDRPVPGQARELPGPTPVARTARPVVVGPGRHGASDRRLRRFAAGHRRHLPVSHKRGTRAVTRISTRPSSGTAGTPTGGPGRHTSRGHERPSTMVRTGHCGRADRPRWAFMHG